MKQLLRQLLFLVLPIQVLFLVLPFLHKSACRKTALFFFFPAAFFLFAKRSVYNYTGFLLYFFLFFCFQTVLFMSIFFLYFSTFFLYIKKKTLRFFFLQCGSGLLTEFLFCLHKTFCLCSFCFVYQFLYRKQYVFFCSAILDYCTGFTKIFFFGLN